MLLEGTLEIGVILTGQRGAGLKKTDSLLFGLSGRDLREAAWVYRR